MVHVVFELKMDVFIFYINILKLSKNINLIFLKLKNTLKK